MSTVLYRFYVNAGKVALTYRRKTIKHGPGKIQDHSGSSCDSVLVDNGVTDSVAFFVEEVGGGAIVGGAEGETSSLAVVALLVVFEEYVGCGSFSCKSFNKLVDA